MKSVQNATFCHDVYFNMVNVTVSWTNLIRFSALVPAEAENISNNETEMAMVWNSIWHNSLDSLTFEPNEKRSKDMTSIH